MAQNNSKSETTGAKKATGKFSKKIVVWIIILNILFTAAVLYAFLKTGSEPGVLVGAWFAWTTGELWALAGIKKKEE